MGLLLTHLNVLHFYYGSDLRHQHEAKDMATGRLLQQNRTSTICVCLKAKNLICCTIVEYLKVVGCKNWMQLNAVLKPKGVFFCVIKGGV